MKIDLSQKLLSEHEVEIDHSNTYDLWEVSASLGGKHIGYCYLEQTSEFEFRINDLKVTHVECTPEIAKWKFWQKPKTYVHNYRGRGFGKKLLSRALQIAQEQQAQRVYGYIVEKDYNQGLVQFYEGFDFILTEPDGKADYDAHKMIERIL